jgi:poly(A) polymerase
MIKRFVAQVQDLFTRKKPRLRKEPKRLEAAQHGIDRELVSRNALRVCETLQKQGYAAYLVGGAVRDLLLGIAPKDFDIATNATPEQVKAHFRRAIIIGRRFRLVHVMFGQDTVEVSTFRALENPDRETDAHGRVLADNLFGSQPEDAARRDFTINALYYDPITQTVLDYHDGVKDVRRRKLRMIGDPEARYREDPVRMLRAVRFAAKLGFEIDEATRKPITTLGTLIENVPAARLFDEMLKLLTSGHAVACITRLRVEGLHHGLLPLLDMILEQPEGERFVMLALSRTDERVRAGKHIAVGFLFATLLWHEVLTQWKAREARGEHRIPALDAAIDDVLERQTEKLAIQRRFTSDMREIWMLQPRFERRTGRNPLKLLEHLRVRAGYDFLLLRCAAGEAPAELGDWWTSFMEANEPEREALLTAPRARETDGAPKRRRRRGRRGNGGNADRDGADDAGAEAPASSSAVSQNIANDVAGNKVNHRANHKAGNEGR